MTVDQLRPGDVLLYGFNKRSAYSWAIRIKTGHKETHAELFVGAGKTITAKSDRGVNVYDFDPKRLVCVLRPSVPFDLAAALRWFERKGVKGAPYGWLDLGAFCDVPLDGPGMVCSAVTAGALRSGGVPVLKDEDLKKIAPHQLKWVESLSVVWAV